MLDTVAAVATPAGRGGIGIIRLSGPLVKEIAIELLGVLPKPRYAEYLPFQGADGTIIDEGIALYFPAPHSFTGEDVLELQGHGGPIILDCLLRCVLQLGARSARPGEFSERAFLNGKLDLTQAEAIADLIDAESEQAALAAVRSLQGDFSKRIHSMVETLIELRMWLEASIDFTDENIDFLKDSDIEKKLNTILAGIKQVKTSAKQGALLKTGISIAIVGPANVGKSSLLNRLTRQDSAIVSAIAGTTRDVVREKIHLDGLPLHLVDTAGLRVTENEIEQEGIKRSLAEVDRADRILWVVDSTAVPLGGLQALYQLNFFNNLSINKRLLVLRNKIDIKQEEAGLRQEEGFDVISLSVKTGQGLPVLYDYLKRCVGYENRSEGNFSARRRHIEALEKAETAISHGLQKLVEYPLLELLAEDLTIAQNHLNEITGQFTTEDLLGKIFSSFCIGK